MLVSLCIIISTAIFSYVTFPCTIYYLFFVNVNLFYFTFYTFISNYNISGTVLAPLPIFFAILSLYFSTQKRLPDFSESLDFTSFVNYHSKLFNNCSYTFIKQFLPIINTVFPLFFVPIL